MGYFEVLVQTLLSYERYNNHTVQFKGPFTLSTLLVRSNFESILTRSEVFRDRTCQNSMDRPHLCTIFALIVLIFVELGPSQFQISIWRIRTLRDRQ